MNIICPECKAENDENAEFCKNCGTKFSVPDDNDTNGKAPYFGYAYSNFVLPEIDGVSCDDAAAFIGKNSPKLLVKFSKSEISGSKVIWCWPAAILGLFFGICGVGFWFIYRKMYKLGAVIIAASIVISGMLTVAKGNALSTSELYAQSYGEQLADYVGEAQLRGYSEFSQDFEFDPPIRTSAQVKGDIVEGLRSFISVASFVLGGMFSLYAYKKHIIDAIRNYNIKNAGDKYRQIGLMTVGGTAAGFAVLAFFANSIIVNLISRIVSYLF